MELHRGSHLHVPYREIAPSLAHGVRGCDHQFPKTLASPAATCSTRPMPRPRSIAFLVVALAAAAVAAEGPPPIETMRGLEPQEAQLEWKVPPAPGLPENAIRRCRAFTSYAVLGTYSTDMGTADIEFRTRPKGMTPAAVCGAGFHGHSVRPTPAPDALDVMGIFGRYAVGVFPDGFGILGSFSLLDLESGAKVYSDVYEYARRLVFERSAEGPVLTYWSRLASLDCIPRRGESACWKRIRETHHIPATVSQPDCEKAVAERPSIVAKDMDSAQITVRVRVPRLSRRDATYLSGQSSCGLSP